MCIQELLTPDSVTQLGTFTIWFLEIHFRIVIKIFSVCYIAGELMGHLKDEIKEVNGNKDKSGNIILKLEHKMCARLAALCHDLGKNIIATCMYICHAQPEDQRSCSNFMRFKVQVCYNPPTHCACPHR